MPQKLPCSQGITQTTTTQTNEDGTKNNMSPPVGGGGWEHNPNYDLISTYLHQMITAGMSPQVDLCREFPLLFFPLPTVM